MQYIYDRDSTITEQCRPWCSIIEKTQIEITILAGAPDPWAVFYRYQLRWITQPLGFYYWDIVWDFYALYMVLIYLITLTEGDEYTIPH